MEFWYGYDSMDERLNLEMFCAILKGRCPNLQALILCNAELSVCLGTVIDICADFLPTLLKLEFRSSNFEDLLDDGAMKFGGISKIEVLSVFGCKMYKGGAPFSKMPCLKKLFLAETDDFSFQYWFWKNISLLEQVEVLNLQDTLFDFGILATLKEHALKLTHLCMCRARVPHGWYSFFDLNFPSMMEVCLVDCQNVTGADIVYLIQSCPSLQQVYVHEGLAQSYAENPSVVTGRCQSDIVKTVYECPHD